MKTQWGQWGVSAAVAATMMVTGCKKNESEAPKEMPKATEVKPAEPPPPPKPAPLAGDALAKFYVSCWKAFNDKKWDDFGNCYDDGVISNNAGMPEIKGKAGTVEMAKAQSAAFPDGKGEPQIVLVNGKNVASVAGFTGTHTGPLKGPGMETPATGKKVGMMMFHAGEFNDNNKAAKEQWVQDPGTMMFQLGLSKGPGRDANIALVAGDMAEIVVAKNDDTEKKNVDAHKLGWEKFSKHDKTLFDAMADDAVFSSQADAKDCVGKKACSASQIDLWGAFPDITVTPKTLWAAGDYTVAVGQVTGTNTGDSKMMKMKKTGKKVDFTCAEVIKWENGKMKKAWFFMNGMEMAMQLGLIPPPAAAAAPADAKGAAPADAKGAAPADAKGAAPKGAAPADKAAPKGAAPADKAAPAPVQPK